MTVPRPANTVAQAVIGVSVGTLVELSTLRTIGADWLPVLLVTLGTLLLSLGAGLLLRSQPGISPATGAFSMIAGGASGITAIARDLGADARMVAVLQYIRVLLIVVLMPVVATSLYGATDRSAGPAAAAGPGPAAGLLLTVVCVGAGLLLARLAHVPVGSLLCPLAIAAAAVLTGVAHGVVDPRPGRGRRLPRRRPAGRARASPGTGLRRVGRALPVALAIIVGNIVACAGLGAALAWATGAGALDGYLATTPGGLYVVLATATHGGADTTFVLAVQVLRLLVMLLSAPLLARLLRARVP